MNGRHDRIVDFIGAKGEASVQELANEFNVSLMTVRRDLMLLEQAGRVTRTHGGAILSRPGVVAFSFLERGERCAAEKQAIAGVIAAMIKPGSTVALDSGTTTLEVAKAMAGIEGATVLTSSLAIAAELYTREGLETVLLGGAARKGSPDLTGWLTEENLKRFHVDFAVVGADGVTREGAYTTAVDLARICQSVLASGTTSILAVDHSKIGRPSFSRFAELNAFDHIVTDTAVPAASRRWLKAAAKNVIYAKVK
ncbi:MAG: DeoR/GlpR transcriptional regulator [Candidatus Hydrogenedentes bacterium]|nr:DeoR/GlpR transcriptional regulator [Candidatus Hydrogenedentota bacterium]